MANMWFQVSKPYSILYLSFWNLNWCDIKFNKHEVLVVRFGHHTPLGGYTRRKWRKYKERSQLGTRPRSLRMHISSHKQFPNDRGPHLTGWSALGLAGLGTNVDNAPCLHRSMIAWVLAFSFFFSFLVSMINWAIQGKRTSIFSYWVT